MTTMVTPLLHRSRDAVEPALRAAVDRLDPTTRALSAYHLGWTEADGTPRREAGGGKALRPALVLLGAEACGGTDADAVPSAVAVELVHNFSLVHDDLMDGDTERRHRATVWAVWGSANAILTGDAMVGLALEVVLDSGSPHAVALSQTLLRATRELIRGQVEDLQFEQRAEVTLDECLRMVAGKTGALIAASAGMGALAAGAPPATVAALTRYGDHLGTAFQLVDDLLGIWGEPAVTGKPVLNDLRSRKKSLPVAYALSQRCDGRDELADWLRTPPAPAGDAAGPAEEAGLRRAAELVEACGARAWTAAEARRQVDAARAALDEVDLRPVPRAELDALADFVVGREH
ncbi:polyprenyl synthetase family protein [Modestobacter sp. NPDC049651]|uniref:polyprenyl synthetase family protein n=1 Tax=unclassified Modestobacter TaxID=2643866 RepID=UPI0033D5CEB3